MEQEVPKSLEIRVDDSIDEALFNLINNPVGNFELDTSLREV